MGNDQTERLDSEAAAYVERFNAILAEIDDLKEQAENSSLDDRILQYVKTAKADVDCLDSGAYGQKEIRAILYAANHYRYQAGILCEAANFLAQEAEAALVNIQHAQDQQLDIQHAQDQRLAAVEEKLDRLEKPTDRAPTGLGLDPKAIYEVIQQAVAQTAHYVSGETGEASADGEATQGAASEA